MTDVATAATPGVVVHVTDPGRRPPSGDGVRLLAHTATAAALASELDTAAMLVVDDALAFPFEGLREVDRDIPLVVRVPRLVDADALREVLGRDLLDHLTPYDVVAGPTATWRPVLGARHLPLDRIVGDADLTAQDLVARARRWLGRHDPWTRPPESRRGAPVVPTVRSVPPEADSRRVRWAKAALRVDRDALRRTLATVEAWQPPTRPLHALLVAPRPVLLASALPRSTASVTAVDLDGEGALPPGARGVTLPEHLWLDVEPASHDVAVLAADVLHLPAHVVGRLVDQCLRSLRPAGTLVVQAEVVPPPQPRGGHPRPIPMSAPALVDLVGRVSGRRAVLADVRAVRRHDDDHRRLGVLLFRHLSTPRSPSWT